MKKRPEGRRKENHVRTLEEIEALDKTMLIPTDVAGYLGCEAYSINRAARDAPGLLGFPITVMGTRVRIPKEGFLRWARGLEEGRTS